MNHKQISFLNCLARDWVIYNPERDISAMRGLKGINLANQIDNLSSHSRDLFNQLIEIYKKEGSNAKIFYSEEEIKNYFNTKNDTDKHNFLERLSKLLKKPDKISALSRL